MSNTVITVEGLGKLFCRSLQSAFLYALQDRMRKLLRRKPVTRLRKNEFWALRELSFSVMAGECLGIIGPNGAGKSTLLKLISRDLRPSTGSVVTAGQVKALIRIGTGLQPMLSGRENIYVQCSHLGLGKQDIDRLLDGIVGFAGLEKAIDTPVKTYSNGMYARLEFAIATSVRTDILLIDEVLAVGDIAFQLRALDRLNQLKREGTAIVFVSHSEMNVRQVADRCLLLFNGRQLALGKPDALFYKYYESIGYLNRQLAPLGATPAQPDDLAGEVTIRGVARLGAENAESPVSTGDRLELIVTFEARQPVDPADLTVQFWNTAGILLASVDSRTLKTPLRLRPGSGQIRVELGFLPLTPGLYRIATGFFHRGRALAYARNTLELLVGEDDYGAAGEGLLMLEATLHA